MGRSRAWGLFAITAVVAVGAFGAGTAGAIQIQLCANGESGTTCQGTIRKEEDGPIGFYSSNSILTTSITNVTCDDSSFTLDPNSSTGNPVTGTITELSFSGSCKTSSGTSCTVSVVNLPYSATMEPFTLTITDSTGAGAQVKCGFLMNCTFTTKDALLSISNTTPFSVVASGIALTRSGGFCPETAEWHADYSAILPSGFMVLIA